MLFTVKGSPLSLHWDLEDFLEIGTRLVLELDLSLIIDVNLTKIPFLKKGIQEFVLHVNNELVDHHWVLVPLLVQLFVQKLFK